MLDAITLAYVLRQSLQERSTAGSAPLLYDLTPGDAVDEYAHRLTLLTSRRHEAKIRPSVVDGARCEASYHHVVVGCLVLDGVANVGESGAIFCDPLHEALAPGVLAGKQAVI